MPTPGHHCDIDVCVTAFLQKRARHSSDTSMDTRAEGSKAAEMQSSTSAPTTPARKNAQDLFRARFLSFYKQLTEGNRSAWCNITCVAVAVDSQFDACPSTWCGSLTLSSCSRIGSDCSLPSASHSVLLRPLGTPRCRVRSCRMQIPTVRQQRLANPERGCSRAGSSDSQKVGSLIGADKGGHDRGCWPALLATAAAGQLMPTEYSRSAP